LLDGKTKTHTRAMYTDAEYRRAIVYSYATCEAWTDSLALFCQAMKEATTKYKFLHCPFCV